MERHQPDHAAARRDQFLSPRKSRRPWIIAGAAVVLAAAALFLYLGTPLFRGARADASGQPAAAPRSYVGRVVQAQPVKPAIANGRAALSLADVDRLNIVDFSLIDGRGVSVPVMAYISSSGRLFVGRSLCSCGGTRFFLAGEALVCSNCRSTYGIENQAFLSGTASAGRNPPAKIRSVVEDGMIVIDLKDI